jgi:hypothetical protein
LHLSWKSHVTTSTTKCMPLRLSANNQKVVPVIPYHVIGCPFLSANSDSSVSFSLNDKRANAENPLDILASRAIKRLQLTFPNQCSYEGCGVWGILYYGTYVTAVSFSI